tara:strand:+ start:383 stop:622 length:240 start_codon:yes stop_codon:yes gene_type:complete
MIEVIQSITQKKYTINEDCKTILELKKALLTQVNNGMICNFKIVEVSLFDVKECKNEDLVNNNKNYMLITVPIECPSHN